MRGAARVSPEPLARVSLDPASRGLQRSIPGRQPVIGRAPTGLRRVLIAAIPLAATALALLGGLLLGCTPQRRYDLLSFFLDGVPDPSAAPARQAGDGPRQLPRTSGERIQALGYELPVVIYTVHQPYEEKECDACHLTPRRRRGSEQAPAPLAMGPALLRMPLNELCFSCHSFERKHKHGPAAAGGCTLCHYYHKGPNPGLLITREPRSLCVRCHLVQGLEKRGFHQEGDLEEECITCHDPHESDEAYLLREKPARLEEEEPEGVTEEGTEHAPGEERGVEELAPGEGEDRG
ncbi:MAG: cytochrome c3 family protein [Planctomycetota bacterium]